MSTHASSMRMVVCSSRRCNVCGLWKNLLIWYDFFFSFVFVFLNRKHEAIIFCAVKSVCLGHIQLATIIWINSFGLFSLAPIFGMEGAGECSRVMSECSPASPC